MPCFHQSLSDPTFRACRFSLVVHKYVWSSRCATACRVVPPAAGNTSCRSVWLEDIVIAVFVAVDRGYSAAVGEIGHLHSATSQFCLANSPESCTQRCATLPQSSGSSSKVIRGGSTSHWMADGKRVADN